MDRRNRTNFETSRLAQLDNLGILDTPVEESFERITRIVGRVMACDLAGISLVDEDRVWFKALHGADLVEIPRAQSFCAVAIERDEPLIVEDAEADRRFRDIELVLKEPCVRSYAGAPISLTNGLRLGTVCVFSRKPVVFDRDDVAFLQDMAATTAAILRNRLVHNLTR